MGLALLAIITFVVSNQSGDTEIRALGTSLEDSSNIDHVIAKRDAKDPEKKKIKKKNSRGKKTKVKASKKKSRRNEEKENKESRKEEKKQIQTNQKRKKEWEKG